MKSRIARSGWFIIGAAAGFGGIALAAASLGAIVLLPALAIGAFLLVFRLRSAPMFLIGACLGIAVPWGLHITSGDTPDSDLWPVLVGLTLVAAGAFMFVRQKKDRAGHSPRSFVRSRRCA